MTGTTLTQSDLDLKAVNDRLADAEATEIIEWAVRRFGQGLVMTSSFGVQSAVMLHLVTRVVPDLPVIFVDTGFLFPETYQFAEKMTERLKLKLKVYQSPISPARMVALYGRLWEQEKQGLDRYDQIRKVEPLRRALDDLGAAAWLSGLRHEQTELRATLPIVGEQDGRYKVLPILNWTNKDVHEYLERHDLPYNPLREKGYVSLGDWHSTRPLTAEDARERDTRFQGLKQECGLHLPATEEENLSRESSGL
ncbi:MAG: phosphoadenylyl-sulfate reductase [Phycisphaeraceae bacterium]